MRHHAHFAVYRRNLASAGGTYWIERAGTTRSASMASALFGCLCLPAGLAEPDKGWHPCLTLKSRFSGCRIAYNLAPAGGADARLRPQGPPVRDAVRCWK